jgi:ABC-type sugar transport system permease subunit
LGPIKFVGLKNYSLLLKDNVFWNSMVNGVLLFFIYVPLQTLLALILAVVLNSKRVHGFRLFRTLIFVPNITNMVAAGYTFKILMNHENGLFNVLLGMAGLPPVPWLENVWAARISLGLLIIWAWLGWNMVIMLAGLQTIPGELTEAALIDGASQSQAFFFVTVPLMRQVILFALVLSTMGTFSLFTEPFVLTGGGPMRATQTPIMAIFGQAFNNFRFGYASALSYVYFAIIFVLTLIQVRLGGRREA